MPLTNLPNFDLEQYFAIHEFTAKTLLGCSDAETMAMQQLLSLADEECKQMWDTACLGYTESRGDPILRVEIAKEYESCEWKHVLCFAGAEEGMTLYDSLQMIIV